VSTPLRPVPVVSVALCTHNGALYLGEQLRSILAQTRVPDEVVISDDASTDGTIELARAVLAESTIPVSLTVISNTVALGVTGNFEQAVRACRGDIIVLSDQDDVWHRDRVAIALTAFDADPDLLFLHSNAQLVDETGRPIGYSLFAALQISRRELRWVRSGRAVRALLRRNLATGATAAFRTSLLDAALPFPAPWVHDEWLAIIAAVTGRIDYRSDSLIDYRQHGANQIGATRSSLVEKSDTLRGSRYNRIDSLIVRTERLRERVLALGDQVHPGVLLRLDDKLSHLRARRGLPAAPPLRIPGILAGIVSGRYDRYGRGLYDVARDLLQRAG